MQFARPQENHVLGIAILLTLLRILFGPLFLLLYLYYDAFSIPLKLLPYLLICLMALSELSDLFDGLLARKKNQVTNLGKILDPMADSIFRISVLLTFTQGIIRLPMILVFVFIYRDMVISTLRTVCALKGVALAARLSGKIKAVLQAVVGFFILLLLIPYSWGLLSLERLRDLSLYAVSLAALYTLLSAAEYLIANRSYIKRA